MKKIIYSFFILNIVGFSLFGISYGIDCSVYDDLISTIEAQIGSLRIKAQRASNGHFTEEQVGQVLATSKYADEYNSLVAEYNSAIQQKENCLSNSSSIPTSNSNYNNDNSYSNKSQNQICKEEFGTYSIAIGDECGCKDGYIMNGAQTKCVKDTIEQRKFNCSTLYGNKSIYSEDDELCMCIDGYTMNENRSKCVQATIEQKNANCSARNNGNAHYSEQAETCVCNDGYIPNEDETQCVKDTIKQRKLNCSTRYGNQSILADNGEDCDCSDGYVRNEENTQCVKDTQEQREKNCKTYSPISFLGDDGDSCECPEGYVADSGNPNYCLIALDQKSLQSRIMNTKDAKCDSTDVILSCNLEPTKDSCPAVCLELYDAINWMYDNELTIYNDPTKFGIYNPITREQASKFFVNFYVTAFDKKDKIIAVPVPNPFKDTTNADPTLKEFILKSFTLKLFKGTNGKFMPFNHLTKAQALAVIIRMTSGILDESQQPRYSNYLYKAESIKLLDNINYSYTTLDNEDIVRGDVALILYRLYEYLENN